MIYTYTVKWMAFNEYAQESYCSCIVRVLNSFPVKGSYVLITSALKAQLRLGDIADSRAGSYLSDVIIEFHKFINR